MNNATNVSYSVERIDFLFSTKKQAWSGLSDSCDMYDFVQYERRDDNI